MYSNYKYTYMSKINTKHHTLIQVCILNINTKSYSYASMYTKYKYKYVY